MSYPNIALDTIETNQDNKEVTANNLFEAESPAALFGCDAANTSGLTFGYYGGVMFVDGVVTAISSGTIGLTLSTTNYVEATRAGVVSANTTGFTAGRIPLYTIVTVSSTISSVTSARAWVQPRDIAGRLALAMTDANTTLTAAQARNQIIEFTGTLTAQRNIVLPLGAQQWTVYNNTTGGFGLQFIGATGTGIVVAATKRAIIYADGTNLVRVTADA
jgi:hypothetical protein